MVRRAMFRMVRRAEHCLESGGHVEDKHDE